MAHILGCLVALTSIAFVQHGRAAPPESPQISINIIGAELDASWTASDGATGYRLFYAPAPYQGDHTVQSIDLGVANNLVGNLFEGAAFFLAVVAYNSEGDSAVSNVVEFNITSESIATDFVNSFEVDASRWERYSETMDEIASYYVGLPPTTINVNPVWFNSLQISPDKFSSREDVLEVDGNPYGGVGGGNFVRLPNNEQLVFYGSWAPQTPNRGAAFALSYRNDIPVLLDYTAIEGVGDIWVTNDGDGTRTAVFLGVDEGKLENGDPASSPVTYYDLETRSWAFSNFTTATGSSNVFDFDSDGDDDIFSSDWDTGSFYLKNNNGAFEKINLPTGSGMAYTPISRHEDGTLSIILGDASSAPQYGIGSHNNQILSLSPDLSSLVNIKAAPVPYFERPEYAGIQNFFGETTSAGISHDVRAEAFDMDGDGDQDIVLSSLLWSHENPYHVLQILINEDGTYVDETDSRLFNWSMVDSEGDITVLDVNGDGFEDVLTSVHGYPWRFHDWSIDGAYLSGARVLLNDGTGHFVTVAHQQINNEGEYWPSHIPFLDDLNQLRWSVIRAQKPEHLEPEPDNQVEVFTRYLNMTLSTGPNGADPAKWGAPGFNEFYYLLHNADVREDVEEGIYSSGLEHYLLSGKAAGRASHAP